MDPKDLSPAYFTSLASLLIGALLVGVSSSLLFVVGWVLLLAGMGLNIFSTLIMVQHFKGGELPTLFTGGSKQPAPQKDAEDNKTPLDDIEPVTESHEIIPSDAAATSDERIFRPRPPQPHVR